MLKIYNINLTLGKSSPISKHVLKNISLHASKGEFLILIGSNGTGKSTLLNVIAGYIKPDSGSIIVDNIDITNMPQNSRVPLIAKVVQDPKLGTMSNMTIEENLCFAYLRGKNRSLQLYNNKTRREFFRENLSLLNMGLENRLNEKVINLSGGQRQALSLIMAITTDFKVLLLDEITAALDPKTASTIMNLTAKIIEQKKEAATIMITHNMAHALHYGNRTILIENGSISQEYNVHDKIKMSPIQLAAEFCEI